MNRPRSSYLCLLALWPISAVWLAAAPSPQTSSDSDQPVELSPFVVQVERDVGFVAASSVAGGRLAGDLKDTPVAYSVQTREFIDALGLTNISEASQWAVNTASVVDYGASEVFGATTQISIRGGGSAATQRDFFPFSVNYDSYNLERIDYARGPNAVLFGNGDYSGTINAVSRSARTDRSFGDLKLSYGSWDNARVTVDANAALNKTLALRFDGVLQDRDGWRKFEMERKKAATLAAVVNLTSTTQLRLQGEVGKIERNSPFTTFFDRFTGWDGATVLTTLIPTAGLPSDANAKGYSQYGNATTPVFAFAPAFGGTLDISRTAQTLGGNAATVVPVGGVVVVGPTANVAGQPFNEGLNLPASRFDKAIAGSKFRYPDRTYAVSTNNPSFVQTFRSFSGFLTQQIGENLFASVDANYSKETRPTEYINNRGTPNVYIDINQNLPDGTANPEFLQPYSEGYRLKFSVGSERKSARAALAYVAKKTRFGDFSLNGSWQHSTSTTVTDPYVYVVKRNADPRLWSNTSYNDAVIYRYYWDQKDYPTPEIGSMTYKGVTYPAGWVKDIANGSATPNISYTTLNTLQLAAKAKLFNGRIHLVGAGRHDEYVGRTQLSKLPGDYPADWNGRDYVWRPAAPADYASLTYVPKNASGTPTGAALPATARPRTGIVQQAQYANDRFQDDFSPPDVRVRPDTYTLGVVGYVTRDLGAFYNYSTTFNPSAARQSIFNTFYGPQVAAEWDAGLRHSLAGGKLSVSLGYYQGRQTGQVFDPSLTPQSNLNTIILASPRAVAPPAPAANQGNSRGVAPVPRFFDTRDLVDHGWEFEVVANPTKSWRITFNAAMPRAYQTNVSRDFTRYMQANDTALRQVVADAGVLIDGTTGVATVDTSVPTNVRSPDAGNVASAWNSLNSIRANIVTGEQLVSRMPLYSGNLFTDYTFREGVLKQLKLGIGVNYRGRQAIGYHGADTVVNPANATQGVDDPSVDALDPVYVHGYTVFTAVVGYNWKLNRRHSMQLELKVDNLLDYSEPLYVNTLQRPVGGNLATPARVATPAQLTYLTPRNVTLTASIRF